MVEQTAHQPTGLRLVPLFCCLVSAFEEPQTSKSEVCATLIRLCLASMFAVSCSGAVSRLRRPFLSDLYFFMCVSLPKGAPNWVSPIFASGRAARSPEVLFGLTGISTASRPNVRKGKREKWARGSEFGEDTKTGIPKSESRFPFLHFPSSPLPFCPFPLLTSCPSASPKPMSRLVHPS